MDIVARSADPRRETQALSSALTVIDESFPPRDQILKIESSKSSLSETHSEELETLRRVPIFSTLNDEELSALRKIADIRELVPGEEISEEFGHSKGFYIIAEGKVEFITKSNAGKTIVVGEAGPGEYFGELSVLSNEAAPFITRTTRETTTLEFDPDEFEHFIENHPKAAVQVLKTLSTRVAKAERVMHEELARTSPVVKDEKRSFGQRVADTVASTVGGWTFVLTQSALVGGWVLWNSIPGLPHFDAFPFILLNLGLSMQAAYTGPMLQMSANRQASRDRQAAQDDHEVNLKTELVAEVLLKRLAGLEKKVEELKKAA